MECEYCKNKFSTKGSLLNHQKTAKYCLKKQNINVEKYKCLGCGTKFTRKYELSRHTASCKLNKVVENLTLQNTELDISNKLLIKENKQKDKIIEELKQNVNDLQEKLKEVAVQAVSRPTTTKNTQINNYIQKLECITDDHIQDQVQHLTIEHIQKGPEGYAEYALEYPLKNRIVCVDYARRKVKFKDKEGNIITDPEMSSVATKLFESIKDRNKALIFSYGTELRERFGDEMDTVVKLLEYKNDVENSADGSKPDFFHDFVRSVCGKTILE